MRLTFRKNLFVALSSIAIAPSHRLLKLILRGRNCLIYLLSLLNLELYHFYQEVFNTIIVPKSVINGSYPHLPMVGRLPWESKSVKELYNPIIKATYEQLIHPNISETIEKQIEKMQAHNQVSIISAGCGDGSEAHLLVNTLHRKLGDLTIYLGGFDINPDNIARATRKIKESKAKRCLFEHGSVDDIDDKVIELKQKMQVPDGTPTIIIFSGVLTLGVISNHVRAMLIVQKARSVCNYLVISGFEPSLLNMHALRHIGFDYMAQGNPIDVLGRPGFPLLSKRLFILLNQWIGGLNS